MKKWCQTILIVGVMVSIGTFLHPAKVHACSCVPPQSVEMHLNRAQEVFAGTVVGVGSKKGLRGYRPKTVVFDVGRTWKGSGESQVKVYTGLGGGDCGFAFEEGKEYLVYAHLSSMYGGKERLVTTICDRTKALSAAQEDLAVLGEGDLPARQVRIDVTPVRSPVAVLIGLAVGTAIIVMMLWLWRRRRMR